MKVWRKAGLGLLIASLIVLTACGSGGSSSAGKGGASGNEILIGVQSTVTGSEAKSGQDNFNAIQLATDEINGKGGINGKKIKLVSADDACDPQTATAAANKLVSQGVVAIVGGQCSGAVLPASGVYHLAGIPMMAVSANSAKIPAQGYKEIFMLNPTTEHEGGTASEYMLKTVGAKRIAIVHDNSAFAKDVAEITKKAVQQQGGEVVAFEAVNPEEKDFSSLLTKLKSLKPEATYWTGYYGPGGLLIKQFKQLGVPGVIGVGTGANDKTLIDIAGKEAAEGTFVTALPTPELIPSAKPFIDAYKAKFKQDPGAYSPVCYDGMRIMADAIARANSTDKAAIVKALKETKDFKTFGGDITFKEDGSVAKSTFLVIQVKDGKFSLLK